MRKRSPVVTDDIGPRAKIHIEGAKHPYIANRPLARGWELKELSKEGKYRILTYEEYARRLNDKTILIEPNNDFDPLAGRSKGERRNVHLKLVWANCVELALRMRLITDKDGDKGMERVIDHFLPEVGRRMEAWDKDADYDYGEDKRAGTRTRKAYVGSQTTSQEYRPCGRWLKQVYRKYQAADRRIGVLRKRTERSRKGGRTVSETVRKIVLDRLPSYSMEARRSVAGLTRLVGADVSKHNKGMPAELHERKPCWDTVHDLIEDMPAGQKIIGRYGKTVLRRRIGPYGEGPVYYRIGELTQADCWNVPLFTWWKKEDLLGELPTYFRDQLEEAEKAERLMLAAMADVTSGYISGMAWGATESTSLTLKCLRMSLSDRTAYARMAGCTRSWNHLYGLEGLQSDAGPVYDNSWWQSAASSLADRYGYAASGEPNLRGLIESIFSTIHKGFIAEAVARAFENVVARGEYEAQKRAVLHLEEFLQILIRYVVDVYHYMPRDGGLRRCPADELETAAANGGIKLPPNQEEIRVAFGLDLLRKPGPHGIQVMYVEYDSDWFVHHRAEMGMDDEVTVRLDPEDIGAISVLLDGVWITVPAKDQEFRGVSLDEWTTLLRDLRDRFGPEAEVNFDEVVAPALLDIDKMHRTGALRLDNVFWDEDMYRQAEETLFIRQVYDRRYGDDEPAPSFAAGTVGKRFTRKRTPALPAPALEPTTASELEPGKSRKPLLFRKDIE